MMSPRQGFYTIYLWKSVIIREIIKRYRFLHDDGNWYQRWAALLKKTFIMSFLWATWWGHRWQRGHTFFNEPYFHYNDVIMGAIASQITSLTILYSTVYSDADQRKHQSSASLAFVLGIHREPVNSPHKGPVTWKMFPFDDVIMRYFLSYRNVVKVIAYVPAIQRSLGYF